MKKILLITAMATTLTLADFIGGEVNLGYYSHSPSGTAENHGDRVDIEEVLHLGTEQDILLKAYLEHPIPVVPNLKVGYTPLSHEGSGTPGRSFIWDSESFSSTDDINTKFDLNMYDIALYYEIIDILWMNFDLGLNIKYIDGSVEVDGEKENFELPIPMLYAKARFDIPTTDVSLQVEGNYIAYDDNALLDLELGVRYTLALGLGFEAGYKTIELEIDEDDFEMDTTFSGLYGKVVWDF
jgi:outer membrane protein